MLSCILVLEDTTISASVDVDNHWQVTIRDCDNQWSGRMTNLEFSAMCALALGLGEEEAVPQNVAQVLYGYLDQLQRGDGCWDDANVHPVP